MLTKTIPQETFNGKYIYDNNFAEAYGTVVKCEGIRVTPFAVWLAIQIKVARLDLRRAQMGVVELFLRVRGTGVLSLDLEGNLTNEIGHDVFCCFY